MDDVRGLKELQLDALKEVANIGAGHAATALSQLTGRTIMIGVPEVNIRPLEEVPELLGASDEVIAAVLARAKRDGLADAVVETLTDEVLLKVLARPGFSTARQVTDVSGRGVGVEVALARVRSLGGTLDVHSEAGRGTTWTVRVPLTLAIVRALLAEAGGERYAVPLAFVSETVEFDPGAVTAIRQREALVVRERVIPTVHLRDLVAATAVARAPRRPTIILEVGERRTALVVDALLGQQDIVTAPFDAPRGLPAYLGGATILADGAPALILDAAALV